MTFFFYRDSQMPPMYILFIVIIIISIMYMIIKKIERKKWFPFDLFFYHFMVRLTVFFFVRSIEQIKTVGVFFLVVDNFNVFNTLLNTLKFKHAKLPILILCKEEKQKQKKNLRPVDDPFKIGVNWMFFSLSFLIHFSTTKRKNDRYTSNGNVDELYVKKNLVSKKTSKFSIFVYFKSKSKKKNFWQFLKQQRRWQFTTKQQQFKPIRFQKKRIENTTRAKTRHNLLFLSFLMRISND